MMYAFSIWWSWLALSAVLLIAELFLPTFLFLGFSIGAALTGIAVYAIELTLPLAFLLFSVSSLIGWLGLRKLYPPITIVVHHEDINDN